MKFEFAKATDITEFAKRKLDYMYNEYEKIYITPDTNDYHILRVLKGVGNNYEPIEGSYILEHQMINKPKGVGISSTSHLLKILEEDDGGNYDYIVMNSLEDCIEEVDGGFGIN